MAKKLTKRAVHYRRAGPMATQRCATCVMFRAPGSCTLVQGKPDDDPILPEGVCDRWAPKTGDAK